MTVKISALPAAGSVAGTDEFETNQSGTSRKATAAQISAYVQSQMASGFPAGTAMLFVQTAAPTGWTKSTTHDNKALRIVSGSASSGGSVAFTTAFASQAVSGTVGNTTLTTAQIPSHNHNFSAVFGEGGVNSAGSYEGGAPLITVTTSSTGGGGTHNHSFTGTAINLAVQYVDVIIATKN
jgi:hypothetical protein